MILKTSKSIKFITKPRKNRVRVSSDSKAKVDGGKYDSIEVNDGNVNSSKFDGSKVYGDQVDNSEVRDNEITKKKNY